MARLSKSQDMVRREIVDLGSRRQPLECLGRGIVEALGRTIPTDGFRLLGIDPSTLLVNRVIAASDNDGWARSEWLREIYLRSGDFFYVEIHEMMRLGLTAVAMHERQEHCWGFPREVLAWLEPSHHHEKFHELRSPVGGTLFGCFAARGRWVAALQFYRREAGQPFRRTDVAFLRLMSPTIGEMLMQALYLAPLREQSNGTELPEASGVIILDRQGRTSFQTLAGAGWRQALSDSGEHLPGAVLAAAASARAHGGAGVVLAHTDYGPVRVEAAEAGDDGSLAVVIAPERARQAPVLPLSWELTPSEQQVAELALRGLDNPAIAARLFISPETVRTHLRHIYEKLGIRGRNQLLARYFESTLPTR